MLEAVTGLLLKAKTMLEATYSPGSATDEKTIVSMKVGKAASQQRRWK